jgi:hypothetical protein
MTPVETEAMLAARHAVLDAARAACNFNADFTCQADNYDRPIAETPWLAAHRYGDAEYDARWYAVRAMQDHFNESIAGRLNDALMVYAAVAFIAGMESRDD